VQKRNRVSQLSHVLLKNDPDIMTPECKEGASSAPGAGAKAAVANLTTSVSISLAINNDNRQHIGTNTTSFYGCLSSDHNK